MKSKETMADGGSVLIKEPGNEIITRWKPII